MAQISYLFRFDGSRDNDEFMALRRSQYGDRVYAGTPMKVGPWVPDYLEVAIDHGVQSVQLTLIELEATENAARASCRKYLPENSASILGSFAQYLDSILEECRIRSDPRLPAFKSLKEMMAYDMKMSVRTAGALRSSPDLLETFALLDQPERRAVRSSVETSLSSPSFLFQGARRMSREEFDGLRRVVRFVHAVFVGKDHATCTIKGYANLNRKPLESSLEGQPARYPELCKVVSPSDYSGASIECEMILRELRDLWSAHREVEPERIRRWITEYHPIVSSFPQHEPIQNAYVRARVILAAD